MQKISEFNVQEMLPIGLTLVVIGIGIAYGLQVMGDVRDDMGDDMCGGSTFFNNGSGVGCTNSTGSFYMPGNLSSDATSGFNGTTDAITGVSKLPEKLPTIVAVIVAAIIIGILLRYLLVRM